MQFISNAKQRWLQRSGNSTKTSFDMKAIEQLFLVLTIKFQLVNLSIVLRWRSLTI